MRRRLSYQDAVIFPGANAQFGFMAIDIGIHIRNEAFQLDAGISSYPRISVVTML